MHQNGPFTHKLLSAFLLSALTVAFSRQKNVAAISHGSGRVSQENGAAVPDESVGGLLPLSDYSIVDLFPGTSSAHRLASAQSQLLARELAKEELEQGDKGVDDESTDELSLRPQRRWLLRTESLKDGEPLRGLRQYAVKRVVSESELNSLLKNAWLGKK